MKEYEINVRGYKREIRSFKKEEIVISLKENLLFYSCLFSIILALFIGFIISFAQLNNKLEVDFTEGGVLKVV